LQSSDVSGTGSWEATPATHSDTNKELTSFMIIPPNGRNNLSTQVYLFRYSYINTTILIVLNKMKFMVRLMSNESNEFFSLF
jgi:hypothetical protein